MATTQLDRIVKGAPASYASFEQTAHAARTASRAAVGGHHTWPSSHSPAAPHALPLDPVSHLPSSPPQIYLNLLILEASLRAQYLSLRARLRMHMLLLGALLLWTVVFVHLNFFRLREDGQGQGGSVYWVVDTGEKMGLVGGMITWALVWVTGLYDRGVRWPRRWVNVTNRGLRGFNMKVVVTRGSFWKETLGYLSLLGPFGYWAGTKGIEYQAIPRDLERTTGGAHPKEKERLRRLEDSHRSSWIEEDVASGGDTISLLLLPKPFSADFREEWDLFRRSYWDKENERRAELRALLKTKERELARREGGWAWWAGWRGWRRMAVGGRGGRARAMPETSRKVASNSRSSRSGSTMPLRERRRDLGDGRSRSSSRSSTPSGDSEHVMPNHHHHHQHMRGKASSSNNNSAGGMAMTETGRRKRATSQLHSSRAPSRVPSEGRPGTPDGGSMSGAGSSVSGKRSSSTLRSCDVDGGGGGGGDGGGGKKEETPSPLPQGSVRQKDSARVVSSSSSTSTGRT